MIPPPDNDSSLVSTHIHMHLCGYIYMRGVLIHVYDNNMQSLSTGYATELIIQYHLCSTCS